MIKKKSLAPVILATVLLSACQEQPTVSKPVDTANRMLDAFYAFDRDALSALLVPGEDADRLLYYQAWAEAANYRVKVRQPCSLLDDGRIECAITVTDDFGGTLGYVATDTFRLLVVDDLVTSVVFEGDDPPIFNELFEWIAAERPEVLSGPCRDLFNGGDTPAECARAVVEAAKVFVRGQAG